MLHYYEKMLTRAHQWFALSTEEEINSIADEVAEAASKDPDRKKLPEIRHALIHKFALLGLLHADLMLKEMYGRPHSWTPSAAMAVGKSTITQRLQQLHDSCMANLAQATREAKEREAKENSTNSSSTT
jgi:hypothetical protein